MKARYRIRRLPAAWGPVERDGAPYGLWDTQEHCWVDKYGRPDPGREYSAANRAVAEMRRRDLNIYEEDRIQYAAQRGAAL